MRPPLQFTASEGLARATRAWLFWLALALAAAHSVAVWHAYTHRLAEPVQQSSEKQHAAETCGICVAVAGIGGLASEPLVLHLHRFAEQTPLPMRTAADRQSPQPLPYAIRAPPLLAA